ncbi:hypothetical protein H6G11_01180 [Cyanobacterium aponinum FACHB-4101]|uniref:hypothetical protein n=1 Tax=Cyanobacterium aponinum TaxID=379064 RepID=UPI001680E28E|nr:hypothetical protein [Cyanobacterium aponinum]MBD2392866.1 hypothetical protein [Cyanobacterium aponinum FACHB-4101]
MNDNLKIDNLDELNSVLKTNNIDINQWNHQQGNKTIEELYQEIKEGESQLKLIQGKLVRLMKVSAIEVIFNLGNNYFQLIEDKQIFLTGIVRRREQNFITEKIKGGENSLQGAYRGLEEEIGLKTEKKLNLMRETVWEKISPSYPNLMTFYKVFNYRIILGEEELKQIRFSEYREQEKIISLFTLTPTKFLSK